MKTDPARGVGRDDAIADAHHGRLEPPPLRSLVALGPPASGCEEDR